MDSMQLETAESVCMRVDPGVCGFTCRIAARKGPKKTVKIDIIASECRQVQKVSETLTELSLKDIFLPLSRNPVYLAAERSGCHPSCAIPMAVMKAAEAALGMALPRDVQIHFQAADQCPASAACVEPN